MLIGNLGRDPDITYVEGNIPVVKFPLATTETYKDRNGQTVPQTEWHNIVLWRGLADMAQKFLHKGSLVYIEGKLKTRTWEDKDKQKRSQTEIIADNLVMLDKKKEHTGNEQQVPNDMRPYVAEAKFDASVTDKMDQLSGEDLEY